MEKAFSKNLPDTSGFIQTAKEFAAQLGLSSKAVFHDFGWRPSSSDTLSGFLLEHTVGSPIMMPYLMGMTVTYTKADVYKGVSRPFGASELFDGRKPILTDYFSSPTPHPKRAPRRHTGVDFAVSGHPNNAMTLPSVSGFKVVEAGTVGGYGMLVRVSNGTIDLLYAHCSRIFVKKGDVLKPGQLLANCGSTGHSTGPHLHLEVRINDVPVNPLSLFDLSR